MIVEYYTNIDTTDWDTEEGLMELFDYMTRVNDEKQSKYDILCSDEAFSNDMWLVETIYGRMYKSLAAKYERTSSLSYKIGKAFESVLGDEDVIKKLAENREVGEKLIDMLGMLREEKDAGGNKNPLPGILNFAKK